MIVGRMLPIHKERGKVPTDHRFLFSGGMPAIQAGAMACTAKAAVGLPHSEVKALRILAKIWGNSRRR
jgi:hypothetical protein